MAKQVIVVRKDLKMPAGKLAAQVAHASTSATFMAMFNADFRNYKKEPIHDKNTKFFIPCGSAVHDWLTTSFDKIVLMVNSEKELEQIYKEAMSFNLNVSKIVDEGRTVFKEPTFTCVGIGPNPNDSIDVITGDLKLYR